jgi:tetratricopeptide (TPR) repeat protein
MDNIENKLNTIFSSYTTFLKKYAAHELLQITKLGMNYDDLTDKEIEESANIYYKNYNQASKIIISKIDHSIKKIYSRIEEHAADTDIKRLSLQWEKDEQPGRVYIWLDRCNFTTQDIPVEELKILQKSMKLYEKQFVKTLTSPHMKRSVAFASLQGLRGKLLLYFKNLNGESLKNIQQSLEKHENPQARKYFYLCSGLIAELEGNIDLALEQYQLLLEEHDEILREDILQRIATIFLAKNDHKNSLVALEALSNISPSYIIHYGDLLRLTGQSQKALTTYLDYLEKVPQNTIVMLKVGNYFRELNIKEGAKGMYEHVLLLEPDNQAAKQLLLELDSFATH